MADAAASASENSAKPKPLGRPVSLSWTRRKLVTVPTVPKSWMIASSVRSARYQLTSCTLQSGAGRTIGDVAHKDSPDVVGHCEGKASRTFSSRRALERAWKRFHILKGRMV